MGRIEFYHLPKHKIKPFLRTMVGFEKGRSEDAQRFSFARNLGSRYRTPYLVLKG